MRSTKAILAVRYTLASVSGGVRRAVGGFLRYVQYRDHHAEPEPAGLGGDADRFLRYVAHRDRSSSKGLLFNRDGVAGDGERRRLATFIERSIAGMPVAAKPGPEVKADRRRAVYRLVLSPEDARGLDLQRLTHRVVEQLEQEVGAPVRWLAAEHRNTAHPHVHLVVAARLEVSPSRYKTVMITRPRLARMKASLQQEIEFQRGHELEMISTAATTAGVGPQQLERLLGSPSRSRNHDQATRNSRKRRFLRRERAQQISVRRSRVLARIAAKYHREAERMAARGIKGFDRDEEEQERS